MLESRKKQIMKQTVLIIDNNIEQLDIMTKIVLEVNENLEVYTVDSSAAAYELLMEVTIDVFIVDVVLNRDKPGDTSGMRLIEHIREIPKYMLTPVIFVTEESDPELYAYSELNCIGYIKKPFHKNEIKKVLKKALHYRTERNEDSTLIFRKNGIVYPIKIRDIVYIESADHMMYVHLCDKNTISIPYKTYSKILYEADADCLFQCSRSIVVNKNYVLGIDLPNRYIVLSNDLGKVDIGSTYRKKVMQEFARLR